MKNEKKDPTTTKALMDRIQELQNEISRLSKLASGIHARESKGAVGAAA